MPEWFLGAGCEEGGCCETCAIESDDFNRANGALGAKWDIRSGSPAVSSNRAAFTDANSFAVTVADNPTGTADGVISATVRATSSNTEVRLIIDYVDDDNYHYAQFLINGGSFSVVKLYERTAGADTLLAQSSTFFANVSVDYYVRLCLLDASLSFGFSSSSPTSLTTKVYYHSTIPHGGLKAGVGTGALPAGTATFDDFVFTKHHDIEQDCEDCFFCTTCDAPIPSHIKLVVTGIANKAGAPGDACSDCPELNGTFILYFDAGACTGGTACSWRSAPIEEACPVGTFGECADEIGGGIPRWVVWMGSDKVIHAQITNHAYTDVGFGQLRHWPYFTTTMEDANCFEWDEVSLDIGEEYPFGAGAWCDYSGATAKVTAL